MAFSLTTEQNRWNLWAPVFLGIGIAGYFSLPAQPGGFFLPILGGMIFFLLLACRFCRSGLMAWLLLLSLLTGMGVSHGRVLLLQGPLLSHVQTAWTLTGVILEVEWLPEGGARLVLGDVQSQPPLSRVRLNVAAGEGLGVGQTVQVRAVLFPLPPPALPEGFDFARTLWFQGLSATGRALGPVRVMPSPPEASRSWYQREAWTEATSQARAWLTRHILIHIPGPAGAVSAALITGEMTQIPRSVMEDYRDSGLAHLLSISGLHMGLLCGLVFFFVRGGLALVPWIALRYPIKKWAASVALAVTFGYLLLAGAPVPAQRSFVMSGFVLLAIMLDRNPVSLRLVAWAAFVLLLFQPEALLGPSFQMSFAAVFAMVAVFEQLSPWLRIWRQNHTGPLAFLLLYFGTIALTTLLATLSTAPFALYHFGRFALWSMASNMLAVPLTGLLVMPFALLSMLLLPFGLEHWAFVPLGWSVQMVNDVAAWVAGWPMASLTGPVLPLWGLIAMVVGGCWLLIWQTAWRWWGVLPVLAGILSPLAGKPPDILVDSRASAMAVRLKDGSLLVRRGGGAVRGHWGSRAGPLSAESWPKQGTSADGSLSCEVDYCLYQAKGQTVALVFRENGLDKACPQASLVMAAVPIRQPCFTEAPLVDRFDLWRLGTHAVWLEPGQPVRLRTVAAGQGDWPWSHRPQPRPKAQPDTTTESGETDPSPDPAH